MFSFIWVGDSQYWNVGTKLSGGLFLVQGLHLRKGNFRFDELYEFSPGEYRNAKEVHKFMLNPKRICLAIIGFLALAGLLLPEIISSTTTLNLLDSLFTLFLGVPFLAYFILPMFEIKKVFLVNDKKILEVHGVRSDVVLSAIDHYFNFQSF